MELTVRTVFRVITIHVAVISAILSLILIRKLHAEGQVIMARLQLLPDKLHNEFKLFTVGNAIMFIGFFLYFIGAIVGFEQFYSLARIIGIVYGIIFLTVIVRWWRRV